jgi:hypothetical protein
MTVKTQQQLDDEFNDWFRRSFNGMIEPIIDELCSLLDKTGKNSNHNFEQIHKWIDKFSKFEKDNDADILRIISAIGGVKNRKTGKVKLQTLDDIAAQLRAEIATEFESLREIIRKDLGQTDTARSSSVINLPAIRK